MTAIAINIHEYINTLAKLVSEDLHPAAPATIGSWLQEMHSAAYDGDNENLARCTKLISKTVGIPLRSRFLLGKSRW